MNTNSRTASSADPVALRILDGIGGRRSTTARRLQRMGGAAVTNQGGRAEIPFAHPWTSSQGRDPPEGENVEGIADLEPLRKVLEATYTSRPISWRSTVRGSASSRRLDPRGDRAEAPPARVPRRGVSDGGRPRVERLGWRRPRTSRIAIPFGVEPAPTVAGPAAIRADEALQPTGPRVEPHVRPDPSGKFESEGEQVGTSLARIGTKEARPWDRTLHGFLRRDPLRHDRAEQLLRSIRNRIRVELSDRRGRSYPKSSDALSSSRGRGSEYGTGRPLPRDFESKGFVQQADTRPSGSTNSRHPRNDAG